MPAAETLFQPVTTALKSRKNTSAVTDIYCQLAPSIKREELSEGLHRSAAVNAMHRDFGGSGVNTELMSLLS
jgi:hypothetical protein